MKRLFFKINEIFLIIFLVMNLGESVFSQSIRKDYREFTPAERDAYLIAFDKMWKEEDRPPDMNNPAKDTVESYARIHSDNFSAIHNSEDDPQQPFLPWHRELLYQFERRLKIHNPDVTIPYWNWAEDRGTSADLWGSSWLGPYDDNTLTNYYVNLGRTFSLPQGFSVPDADDLQNVLNRTNFPDFTEYMEYGPPEIDVNGDEIPDPTMHDVTHMWVNGEMNTPRSPRDPVFLFSHCFIDKGWQDWVNTGYGRTAMKAWINEEHTFDGRTGTGWVDTIMACGAGDIQRIDPDLLWDSRIIRDVWYADYDLRRVTLDSHTVPTVAAGGTKTYAYWTGDIYAEEDFVIPLDANCTFEVSESNSIVLGTGFRAEQGSQFVARRTTAPFFKVAASYESNDEKTEIDAVPLEHDLKPNYPNPFNPITTIEYTIKEAGLVEIRVFDVMGREVATLVNNPSHPEGEFKVNFDGARFASGIYIYYLNAKNYSKSQRMILLK